MAVSFSPEASQHAIASLVRFGQEELEVELSGIQATVLLRFILAEIAPTAYNAGIADAQVFLRDRLADLEATCHEPEFCYWPKGSSVRRKR